MSECWIYPGYKMPWPNGYGRHSVGNRLFLAHRWMKFVVGECTEEQLLDTSLAFRHTCDNPPCCNPEHIVIGTQLDNIADRKARKRSASHMENRDEKGRFKKKTTA